MLEFFKEMDTIYLTTIICLIILISYQMDIRNWNETELWVKGLVLSTSAGTVLLIITSGLRYFDII